MTDPQPSGGSESELDWNRWEAIFVQFAAATGLAVSVFDRFGQRRVGPIVKSGLSNVLAARGLWREGGLGLCAEQRLVARCMDSGQLENDAVFDELQICALPLAVFGELRGVVVIGWVFRGFPSALVNERLARALGAPAHQLWRDVRLAPPVGPARMAVMCDLLQTLVDANAHQTEAIERLQSLSRVRDVFLAQVSHDLRTPLAAITLRIEALLTGGLDNPALVRDALERMRDSANEEARLIEDLIDAARTQTGQLNLRRAPASLCAVVRRAVEEVRPQAERKGIEIRIERCGIEPEPAGFLDASRIQQVFWNLLSNAIKFSYSGGVITVYMELGPSWHEVRVEDQGPGISEAQLGSIFEAFAKRSSENETGLGLGLSIAKHIVELHGGSIRAHGAKQGQGAVLVVRLPVAP